MGDGLRSIHVVTTDESLLASARAAIAPIEGFEICHIPGEETLQESPPTQGDVLLLDAWMSGENIYEVCRRLAGKTRCRTFIVTGHGNDVAQSIAVFSGATGTLERPLTASALRKALNTNAGPAPALPSSGRSEEEVKAFGLPEALLTNLSTGEKDETLVEALIDPETGLFNFGFLNYKVDEEFKRAKRFDHPLSCVMLGYEGQATEEVLRELSAIFLQSSRDTDVLGRFEENSFLFLLPNTGPDGATIMAQRVAEMADEQGLTDLVGDPMQMSVGISSFPNPNFDEPTDLYHAAREAFLLARKDGGGVVAAS
jgi:diguanylate cyclase (GGDEF)-like protein